MPSIEENKRVWNRAQHWQQGGDGWSDPWGNAHMQWYVTLLPRIQQYVPAPAILEIAPGHGRWTNFLKNLADELTVVDLSETAIEACRQRFASYSHLKYYVNDGKSLDMVPDDSVDFVFSFDSLVHVEKDAIAAYVAGIAKKLTRDGVAFLHHSNLADYSKRFALLRKMGVMAKVASKIGLGQSDHWRAGSMSASLMREFVEFEGLHCIGQEKINWRGSLLIDCITTFTRTGSKFARANKVIDNPGFMKEAQHSLLLSQLYGRSISESRT